MYVMIYTEPQHVYTRYTKKRQSHSGYWHLGWGGPRPAAMPPKGRKSGESDAKKVFDVLYPYVGEEPLYIDYISDREGPVDRKKILSQKKLLRDIKKLNENMNLQRAALLLANKNIRKEKLAKKE